MSASAKTTTNTNKLEIAETEHLNFYQQKLAEGGAILAPMAGYTDAPFRKLCRDFGSSWAVTEMVSAKGLVQGDLQGIEIGEPYPDEPDLVIQIFGGEPEIVAKGGRLIYDRYCPKAIDLNMGCPVKKVTGKSCGSKLMQDPERAAEIIHALNAAVPIPVSAKMRLGYKNDDMNVIEVAKALEEAGAAVIAVHGRTAEQKYTGEANWDAIQAVAEEVSIPVIGSGDVQNRTKFEQYKQLGLGVMVARGAMGKPWIFSELLGEEAPDAAQIARIAYKHAQLHRNWYSDGSDYGELRAMRHLRSQLIKYFEFLPDSRAFLKDVESLSDLATFILKEFNLELSSDVTDDLKRQRPERKAKQKRSWKNRKSRKLRAQEKANEAVSI